MKRKFFHQHPAYPQISPDYTGPRIATIHGLMARELMEKHLLRYLREAGFSDSAMYGHIYPRRAIADDLEQAASEGRGVAIIGFSQGGFHAMKVARELEKRKIGVSLLVTIAAGGLGRAVPSQWGFNPRELPGNVRRCINFYSEGDRLGTDTRHERNLVRSTGNGQHLENICFAKPEQISHIDLVRCYPESRVHPTVRAQLLDRLRDELESVSA